MTLFCYFPVPPPKPKCAGIPKPKKDRFPAGIPVREFPVLNPIPGTCFEKLYSLPKMFKMQTKCQGIGINCFNKTYDNYCKNAKKDNKKALYSFNPLCCFENSTDFLQYFFD